MTESINRKFSYILLITTLYFSYALAFVYSFIFKRSRKNKRIRKIAAVWYTPPDLTGSDMRFGRWKEFFEKEGYQYDNFYIGSMPESQKLFGQGSWADKYRFYRINIRRRLKQFFQLRNYDVVWIARGFLVTYPPKKAFFERCIKRMVSYLVVDSTDGGDYASNPELVLDTMRQADRITVGFVYLRDFFSQYFDDVVQFNWTLPDDNYIIKQDYETNELPIIGWMGSPANFDHVKEIEGELNKVAQVKPFKFLYICREEQKDFNISNAIIEHHIFGDDYAEIIAGFDIGIAPCFGETITHKGKIAMKHLEYLLCAIPQVCSPVAISEFVKDDRDVLISNKIVDWQPQLLRLLESKDLRKKLGENSRLIYQEHYTYESEFPKVRDALTVFNSI